jgi:hypothetical protein
MNTRRINGGKHVFGAQKGCISGFWVAVLGSWKGCVWEKEGPRFGNTEGYPEVHQTEAASNTDAYLANTFGWVSQ